MRKSVLFKTKKAWWMQDGASCHCSDKSLAFLKKHFGSRIISRRCVVFWPAASPDLNPLDFSLWGIIEDYVFRSNPKSLSEIKKKVSECIAELNEDEDKLRQIVGNLRKRAELCVQENGGHFEHLL